MLEPRIIIPAEEDTPSLHVYVNPLYSLYHYLVKELRSEVPDPAVADAVAVLARVRNLTSVNGIWPISEQPLAQGSTPQEAAQGLRAKMLESVGVLETVLEQAQSVFLETIWPRHQSALGEALTTLREVLAPRFAMLMRKQGEILDITWPEQIDAFLVTECYAWQGAYSHPLTIDVGQNLGLSLCEIVLHEATHVGDVHMMSVEATSLKDRLIAHLVAGGMGRNAAWNIWHAVIFAASAHQIRTHIDPEHVDYATVRNLYAWFKVPDLPALWDEFATGKVSEQAFLGNLAASAHPE